MVVPDYPWILPNWFDSIDAGMAVSFVDVKLNKVHNVLVEHLRSGDDLLPADESILAKALLKAGKACVRHFRQQGLNEDKTTM